VETVVVTKEVPVEITKEVPVEVVVTATPAPPPEARFDGVTLKISAIEQAYLNSFKNYEDEIFEKYGIKMEFDTVSVTESFSRDMLEFSTLSASHDIVFISPKNMADYSTHLEPLGPLAEKWGLDFQLEGDVLPAFQPYTSWAGVWLGVPFDGDQRSLMYNKDAFDNPEHQADFKAEYGYDLPAPPETWDQYKDAAEFFTGWDWDDDGQIEYGTAEAWRKGLWIFVWWMDRFASYGGVYFDEEMNPLINSPAGMKALQNMLDVEPFVPPGTPNFTNPEVRSFFAKGDTAMITNWSSLEKAVMNPEASDIVGKAVPAVMPGVMYKGEVYRRPPFGAGWAAGIPRYAENKDAAVHVLAFITQPEQSLELALDFDFGVDPWRISTLESDGWLEIWPDYPDYTEQFLNVISETPKIGIPDLQIPGTAEYISTLATELSLAVTGQKAAEQALDDAAEAWDAITDRLGRDRQKALWNEQYDDMKKLGIVYKPEIAE
jgi:multiple sugar transport system substrate-binding protein